MLSESGHPGAKAKRSIFEPGALVLLLGCDPLDFPVIPGSEHVGPGPGQDRSRFQRNDLDVLELPALELGDRGFGDPRENPSQVDEWGLPALRCRGGAAEDDPLRVDIGVGHLRVDGDRKVRTRVRRGEDLTFQACSGRTATGVVHQGQVHGPDEILELRRLRHVEAAKEQRSVLEQRRADR